MMLYQQRRASENAGEMAGEAVVKCCFGFLEARFEAVFCDRQIAGGRIVPSPATRRSWRCALLESV